MQLKYLNQRWSKRGTCSCESRSSLWANRLSCSARLCCSSAVSASCCSRNRFISCVFTVWICTRNQNVMYHLNLLKRPPISAQPDEFSSVSAAESDGVLLHVNPIKSLSSVSAALPQLRVSFVLTSSRYVKFYHHETKTAH